MTNLPKMKTYVRSPFPSRFLAIALLVVLAHAATGPRVFGQSAPQAPPNVPAAAAWDEGRGKLTLRYHGAVIFDGRIHAEDAGGKVVPAVGAKPEPGETRDPKEKVEQRFKFTLAKPQDGVKLVFKFAK